MLLLFRFVLLIVSGRFRKPIGPSEETSARFTVLPTDCDLNWHLNAGRFLSFMDIARIDMLVRMRLLGRLVANGWRPVMGGCAVRYRRSILPFERFDVRSRLLGWDDKWLYLEHIAERNGELCASGIVRVLFRSDGTSRTPDEFLRFAGFDGIERPELPLFVRQWVAAEDLR